MLRSLFLISIPKKTIAFVILVILLLQIDNPLSKETKSLLKKIEVTQSSQAYIYLLGISASPEEDPLVVGRQQYEEFEKASLDNTYQIQTYSDPAKLSFPEAELNCKAHQENCLSSLFYDDVDIKLLLSENQTLINRVKQLHAYNDYRTLTSPTLSERFPEYRHLIWANRLDSYDAINKFKAGDTNRAVSTLLKNISTLRKQLLNQDNLIGKVIYVASISEQIDILSVILSKKKNNFTYSSIPNLTLNEKNLGIPIAREFAMSYNVLQDLDRNIGSIINELTRIEDLPGWINRIGFKPNMTINSGAPVFQKMIDLSILNPAEFAAMLQTIYQENDKSSYSFIDLIKNIRNIQGSILNRVSVPDYDSFFISRVLDLDVKIKIFNQFHRNKQNIERVLNPYYDGQQAFIDENRVCVNGPTEEKESEKRYIRCILIDI